jgi:hypothetical protein
MSLGLSPRLHAQDSVANAITTLGAHLFRVDRGAFEEADLLAPDPTRGDLLNVDSPAILVAVGLGGAFKYDSTGSVRLTVTVDNKTLLDRVVRLRQFLYTKDGRIWVPFVVYGMLCDTFDIKATLLRSGRTVAELSRSIPFLCGD